MAGKMEMILSLLLILAKMPKSIRSERPAVDKRKINLIFSPTMIPIAPSNSSMAVNFRNLLKP